jgi:phosphoglycolate phosphatase
MSSRLPNCIFLDLDGTLLDSLPGIEHSVRAAFVFCNLSLPQRSLREMIGPPIRTILSQAGNVVDTRILAALEDAFRASYDSEGWRKTVCFPAANQVLRIMREQGYRLFAISNKPRHISLQILKAEGILDLFEMIVTRDSRSPAYSEKEEMIRTLLNELQLAPENCLLTGDTMEDAKAANAAGIRFAYMAHGYGEVPEGASVPVDYRLHDFLQFLPLLAKELAHD